MFSRLKALHCITASSCPLSSLSLVCNAILRPLLTYASPGSSPFLSIANVPELERLHRAASLAISSRLSSSPIPLLFEASLPPLRLIRPDSFCPVILRAGPLSSNLLSRFRFGQIWRETKILQILLESFCIHSSVHGFSYFF